MTRDVAKMIKGAAVIRMTEEARKMTRDAIEMTNVTVIRRTQDRPLKSRDTLVEESSERKSKALTGGLPKAGLSQSMMVDGVIKASLSSMLVTLATSMVQVSLNGVRRILISKSAAMLTLLSWTRTLTNLKTTRDALDLMMMRKRRRKTLGTLVTGKRMTRDGNSPYILFSKLNTTCMTRPVLSPQVVALNTALLSLSIMRRRWIKIEI